MINQLGRTDALKMMIETGSPIIRFPENGQQINEEMKAITAMAYRLGIRVTQDTCRIVVDGEIPIRAVMVRLA